MNKKRFIALLGLYAICSVCHFCLGGVAYADNVVVPGGEGNYGTASCKSPDGYQYLCSHTYIGDRGGGMSWRIYQVPSSGYSVSGLQTWSHADLIDQSEADKYLKKLIDGCESWMVIWGWDWLNYGNNTDNILLGPAEDPGWATENLYNQKPLSSLSTFQNNTKISSTDALKLYKRIYPNATAIPSNARGFCADSPSKTLTAYAVTNYRSSDGAHQYLKNDGKTVTGWLNSKNVPSDVYKVSSGLVKHGSSASVTVASIKGNYKFTGYGSSCNNNKTETCTINPLNSDLNVYAYYELRNEFEGQVRVSEESKTWEEIPDSKKKTTGWTQENGKKVIHNINNCDPVNGCTVRFAHWLRRTIGNESTSYKITRTSNYYTISSGTIIGTTTEDFSQPTTDTGNKRVRLEDFTNKLYPGQAVCETLTFDANADTKEVSITACAFALGNAQPDDPSDPDKPEDPNELSGDTSLINIKVRNEDVSKYSQYQREVYAKPGDTVGYRATYYPVLQYTYNLYPERMRIDGGSVFPTSSKNLNISMGQLFNDRNAGVPNHCNTTNKGKCWNNDISVVGLSDAYGGAYSKTYNYENGSIERRAERNSYKVGSSDVGKSLDETVYINKDGTDYTGTRTTPSQVTFINNSNYNVGNVITAGRSKTAHVRVPYNFENETRIDPDQNRIVYAGEHKEFKILIETNPRTNPVTDGTYATKFDNAKLRVRLCDESETECHEIEDDISKKKDIGKSYSDNRIAKDDMITLNIPDKAAGTKVCLRSKIYPANSGDYGNWQNSEGSGTWTEWSDKECFTVAKRPSFQVWGGNIYSAKDVGLSMSVKNNLADEADYPYNMTGRDKVRVFGSWAELSLVAEGEIKGLSSGAGLGYGTTTDAGNASQQKTIETLGGRDSNDYCLMSTLSIENDNCKSYVGNLGRSSGRSGDKSSLLSDFTEEIGTNYKVFNLGSGTFSIKDKDKFGELRGFNGEEITEGENTRTLTTKIIKADGDVTIDTDITYENNGYSNLESIPKIIIYAKNINISCSVTQIDAVLIADEKINTCSDNITDNSSLRSTPLMIRGSVISDTLTLGRTYGAATGKNSVIPAEIINYDTSLYLWANNQSSATTSGKLTETYINELAPRY